MKLKMIIAALCVACVPLAAAADTVKQIRFGVDSSYPPFESKTPSGELEGFDIDLGNAICAKLNAKCVWVENLRISANVTADFGNVTDSAGLGVARC
ncbi:hypothetical protein EHF44_14170 [Cupriavidus pauculus]|uniref:Lysine-arginine-ornithine-binding periplasmic protein n=2 Tax=Cupriavidus TaxID=106589 RepID=A0A0C4YLI8_9BURK|nr:transporter substrate-binding domain-containing protein [Cupriavidus metallidurans]AJG23435.1 Lysine-arginine-ornithine-binding periplasmic protein precursor [Cupriavidus basilensis]AZG14487.1 hypothetical protein EHF44_14170 [Cupriavidus pauculus]MBY4732179.1 transporter substrate-binding domain-containing protein [Cupriavidus pauculus]